MTDRPEHSRKRACYAGLLLMLLASNVAAENCKNAAPGKKDVFWGDLHVHTAYSLDAYSFGTVSSPAEAYAFARGSEITLADGSKAKLGRPLDFAAVTDHAEWFDFLYVCTDPMQRDHKDCRNLRENASPDKGLGLFRQYVVPSITLEEPQTLDVCRDDPDGCYRAHLSQWERIQAQANDANNPCEFTTFVAYEWSATRKFRHTHRNIIFANEQVPKEAFDYIRYPTLHALFTQLDKHCRPEDGCDVISIPHNTNMGDGTTFDVEQETDRELMMRSRIERLVEIFQEKGNSECLSPLGVSDELDCNFEVRLTKHSQPATRRDYNSQEWERMRSTYVRGLLLRGLAAYRRSGEKQLNPLQLGIIGSTDGHTATPGFVNEAAWQGPVFGIGSLDRAMTRLDWNPGGLVAIRAEENTRESLFAAMKRREVYATSGPRIRLAFEADHTPLSCKDEKQGSITMGGEAERRDLYFRAQVSMDRTPIEKIELIKGTLEDGNFAETVSTLWEGNSPSQCVEWRDATDQAQPAFWYVRVSEAETPRWSSYLCRREDRCDEFPGAAAVTRERAWSSPIWYLPDL